MRFSPHNVPLLLAVYCILPLSSSWPSTLFVSAWTPSAVVTRRRSNTVRPTSTALSMVSTVEPPSSEPLALPEKGDDGIYHILNKEQHLAFLEANPDKIVVLKFFAPWCRACKGLEPKFLQIAHDPKYQNLPIVFADLSVQHNKDYVKSLGVLALPSVHLYAGKAGLVESFACGPSKVPILKRKLVQLVNDRVDTKTRELKDITNGGSEESEPCAERPVVDSTTTAAETQLIVGGVVVSQEMMDYMRNDVPYFKDLSEQEFTELMQKAKLLSFDAGSVIMRQGRPGRLFYVMESGEVEICVKAAFEDPLTTPSSYLGTVINTLDKKNIFGERALITGEPRAASIRATDKVRAFAFDIDDIPASSVLSGKKSVPEDFMQMINERYDLDFYNIDLIKDQFKQANMGNQVRGSVNRPEKIVGVDVAAEESLMQISEQDKETILPLLVRFRMVRNAARCFNYIMSTNPLFGDLGEIRRRSMLVSRLSSSQKEEFKETFDLIDSDDNGRIELIELKRVMESVGEIKSDEELLQMINKGNVAFDGNQEITFVDFMGLMAEAEFYQLFKDTFSALDTHNSGFVKAADLDRVLCGMRDLISDDKHSIIDIEDNEMLIDYEQFSRMLLGTHG